MANEVKPKRSYLPGVAPTSAELGSHGWAINWADKILYVKADDGGITSIAIGGPFTLPTASSTVLGGIKVGANLTITNGVLAATGGGSYTLPTATSSVLGGIKVGANLTITDGVLAATGGGSIVEATTAAGFPATGSASVLYISRDQSRVFRWDSSGVYIELGN
jgi:hypothetical protein